MTLTETPLGEFVYISRINNCKQNMKRKLLSMGFTPGACLKVLGITPLGGALKIKIRGYLIAICSQEASNIEVVPL